MLEAIRIIPVEDVHEVLDVALCDTPSPRAGQMEKNVEQPIAAVEGTSQAQPVLQA